MHQKQLVHSVIETVQAVLADKTIAIQETTSLQDLRGFDSLAVVDIIERLEQQLGIEIDPALILPETFTSPLTITDALIQSQQHERRDI